MVMSKSKITATTTTMTTAGEPNTRAQISLLHTIPVNEYLVYGMDFIQKHTVQTQSGPNSDLYIQSECTTLICSHENSNGKNAVLLNEIRSKLR